MNAFVRMLFWLVVLAALVLFGGREHHTITHSVIAAPVMAAPVPIPKVRLDPFYEDAIRKAFKGCGDPCVVEYNEGGQVNVFGNAAIGLLEANRPLIIDGYCVSACAMVADLTRSIACITPNAMFGFHMTNDGFEPPHSEDIAAFVRAHGGFPSHESKRINWMSYRTALRFWRPCP